MRSRTVTRRQFVGTATAGSAAIAGLSFPCPAIANPVTINYTLSWLPTGQYAFLSAGRQLGFFKKRGINLEIARGYGSTAAVEAVSIGKFQMGGAQTGADILSIMGGLDLHLLGAQGYDATLGIVALKKSLILTPKDLEGKTVGIAAAGGDAVFLPAYCKLAGIDHKKLKIVQLDSKIIEQACMSGVVDAVVVTGLSSIPNFVAEGASFTMLPFSKVGLQFYWVNTIISGSFLRKNKEVAHLVQSGILEGMKYMLLHPRDAMERHLKEYPELALGENGKLYVELGMGMTRAIMMAPESIQHGLGYNDFAKIDKQAKIVKQYAAKPTDHNPPPASSYCSNDHINEVTLTSAEWDYVRVSTEKYRKLIGTA